MQVRTLDIPAWQFFHFNLLIDTKVGKKLTKTCTKRSAGCNVAACSIAHATWSRLPDIIILWLS